MTGPSRVRDTVPAFVLMTCNRKGEKEECA